MTVTRLRAPLHERVGALEHAHEEVVKPMAGQVDEMYGLLTKWRNINWFVVKVLASAGGAIAVIAALLTIAEKVTVLFLHH